MRKDSRTVLCGILLTASVFTYLFLILRFPEVSAKGVTEGLKLSADVLIPTLFPFMVVSGFLVNSGYLMREINFLTFLSEKMFRLGSAAFPALILSLLGGYPVGAKTVNELYNKGDISKNEARRMILFAVNPSPSFVISTIGFGMYRNNKIGVIMYISIVFSALTVAVAGRFLSNKTDDRNTCRLPRGDMKLSEAFTSSVKSSAFSMMYICAYVVLFSSVAELFGILRLNDSVNIFLRCVLEVSSGAKLAFMKFSVSQVCALLSFGGISTVFQVAGFSADTGTGFTRLILSRLVSAFISGVYCSVLVRIFRLSAETFSGADIEICTLPSYSFSVSICLVLMAVLFIMGDSIISKKSLTEKAIQSKIDEE